MCFILIFITGIASAQNNFNLELKVPESYKMITPGQTIYVTTKVLNLGSDDRIDITLEYIVTDKDGGQIIKKSETLAVGTQNSFVEEIRIPKGIAPGDYEITANLLLMNDTTASTKESFIVKIDKNKYNYLIYLAIIIMILIVLFSIKPVLKASMRYNHKRKIKRHIKKIIRKRLKN